MTQRKLAFLAIVAFGALALLGIIVAFGRKPNGGTYSTEQACAIAEAIIAQLPGSHAGLAPELETNGAMVLHVDVSASMNGYALADLSMADTPFLKVIDYLSNQRGARLHALSSAYPPGKDYSKDYSFFRSQANYSGSLDMAAAIEQFSGDHGKMHILVTDSQPWDTDNAPAYEKVAGAINDFLAAGGRCALILYRSPYQGFYSSPLFGAEKNNQVFYNCKNRPFAVWVFAHRGAALSLLVEDLASKKDIRWVDKIQFGEPDLVVALAARTRPEENPGKKTGKKTGKLVGELLPVPTGNAVGRVRDYQMIHIKPQAIDDDGYIPLQFDLFATNNLLGRDLARLRNQMRVTLDCWALPEKFNTGSEGKAQSNPSGANSTNVPAKKGLKLEKLRPMELEYTLSISTNALATNLIQTADARMVVRVRQPAKGKRYAWTLTIRPKVAGADIPRVSNMSTPDDRQPDQCDKILKLDEMLSTVAAHTEKYGTLLFLTEFP